MAMSINTNTNVYIYIRVMESISLLYSGIVTEMVSSNDVVQLLEDIKLCIAKGSGQSGKAAD